MASSKSVEIFQYNAFTEAPFAGNPAGVVTDASRLDEPTMQRIARQLNLAETAFLVPPSSKDADVRLRWFTPTQEVTLCGHATIAAFAAAADKGVNKVGEGKERELNVETLSGILRIGLARHDGALRVSMQLPVPRFSNVEQDHEEFAAAWGLRADDLGTSILVHTDLDYWYIPVLDLTALKSISLSSERLARINPRAAFAFYTAQTVDPDSDWHLRFFAPFQGVDEDVVTGSAQGPMGVVFLYQVLSTEIDGWYRFKGEQGDFLGRPGRVYVKVRRKKGVISDVEIAGSAVPMLEGKIRV